jgi:hypothetical protein
MRDLLRGDGKVVREYILAHGAPLRAVNLGGSMCDTDRKGIGSGPADYEALVELLLECRGSVFNDVLAVD